MTRRPPVTVVMPFAGTAAEARDALARLGSLDTAPGDELIVADNAGTVPVAHAARNGITVVRAAGERSPAHARNSGAARAGNRWILFLDADCVPEAGLIDAYFAPPDPPGDDVAALAGEIRAVAPGRTLAERYAAHKGFLGQAGHLAHPYRPRAAAANLMVRTGAFRQVGGFLEGLRAAEDTDLAWRLQEAGWRLEARPGAVVRHRYRTSLGALRRQWRGYAAGRAWLGRRYRGFRPEPAVLRAARRAAGRLRRRPRTTAAPSGPLAATTEVVAVPVLPPRPRGERLGFAAIDALLAAEELAGLTLSNRPSRARPVPKPVVLVADRFPAVGDPLVEYALSLASVRVEASARPAQLDRAAAERLTITYREDDGALARAAALALLAPRRPAATLRTARAAAHEGGPGPLALAPGARRVAHARPVAAVQPLGGGAAQTTAERLAALAGTRARPRARAPARPRPR